MEMTYVDHRTYGRRWMRWGGGSGAGAPSSASSRGTPETRAQIESSTQERARICKYRHIYKRKGSPERRTNAALSGNQSGEIPTASDRKMSNELRVHHLPRVCGTRRGCRSTAALLSPHYCWYLSLNYWTRLCNHYEAARRVAGVGGAEAGSGASESASARCVTCGRCLPSRLACTARAAFRFYLWAPANPLLTCYSCSH